MADLDVTELTKTVTFMEQAVEDSKSKIDEVLSAIEIQLANAESIVDHRRQVLSTAEESWKDALNEWVNNVQQQLDTAIADIISLADKCADILTEKSDDIGQGLIQNFAATRDQYTASVQEFVDDTHEAIDNALPMGVVDSQQAIVDTVSKVEGMADDVTEFIDGSVGKVTEKGKQLVEFVEAIKPILQLMQTLG